MWDIVDEETYYMYYYAEDDQDWYYDEQEDERDTYVDEQKGAIMDHLWYGVDSYGDQQPETCSMNSQCGDNGLTQCCV